MKTLYSNPLKCWFLLYAFWCALGVGYFTLATLDPNPPRGIDCDWCRYSEAAGEVL